MARKKKRSKGGDKKLDRKHVAWGVVVVGVLLLVVLLGSGKAVKRNNAERAVAQALSKLASAKTVNVSATLDIHLPERQGNRQRPLKDVTATVEGDVFYTEDNQLQLAGTLNIESRGRGQALFSDGDVAILADQVLYRPENVPASLNPSGSLLNRWSTIPTALLAVNDALSVQDAFAGIGAGLTYQDTETVAGVKAARFSGLLSAEQEELLIAASRIGVSGNQGLHVLARLLSANNVKTLTVWIDEKTGELVQVEVDFVRPLSEGREFDFAQLSMTFRDYDKTVSFELPEAELSVKPEVFSRLLGGGDLEAIAGGE